MTLQNKNNQFLEGEEIANDASVVDIFDQYGASDDSKADFSSVINQTVASAVSRPNDDVVVATESNEVVEEKQWEKEYEQKQDITPAQEIRTDVQQFDNEKKHLPKEAIEIVKSEEKTSDSDDFKKSDVVETLPPVTQPTIQMTRESYAPKKSTSQKNETKIDPSKKTIAIVDDDVDTLEMYANIFEIAEYNVIRASDGLEALSVIGNHTPNLIFTGIVMPRMDGFAMMEALKQNSRTADIPVVINSHLGREADRKRAEELGAKDFIVRGFTSPREALERIGALLLRSDYTFRFDSHDAEARKLVKDLGASNFFVCPRGQEMVLKLNIVDPKELVFSARFSCVDAKDPNT